MGTEKTVALLIRRPGDCLEGLRSTLGLALMNHRCTLCVLDSVIPDEEEFGELLEFLEEMPGRRLSNVPANVERYGFDLLTAVEIGSVLRTADIIIPFA